MSLSVPYYSQHLHITDEARREDSCAITCLKMVLDFYSGAHVPSLDALVDEGITIGGLGPRGWSHDHIVFLAHNHGCLAYKEEFRSIDGEIGEHLAEAGIEKIKKTITSGNPVIISTTKENGSYHTVLVIGADEHGFIFHDPDARVIEEGANQFMTFDDCLDHWRKLAIFVYTI